MKKIIIFSVLFILNGCSSKITIPVDTPALTPDKATIVFVYHGLGVYEKIKIEIFIDNSPVGAVTTMTPLTITIPPGQHDLYAKADGPIIDRITTSYFERNKVYYMSVWIEGGMWAGSIRISPIPKLTEFEVIKYPFQ